MALQLHHEMKVGLAVARWKKFMNKSKNRYYRIQELYTTENDYRNDLIIIRDHIGRPLREQQLISQNEERSMFGSIESMIQLSTQMISELEDIYQNWDRHSTLLGAIMKKYSKFLLVYSDYFKNLTTTQNTLRNLVKTNPKAK